MGDARSLRSCASITFEPHLQPGPVGVQLILRHEEADPQAVEGGQGQHWLIGGDPFAGAIEDLLHHRGLRRGRREVRQPRLSRAYAGLRLGDARPGGRLLIAARAQFGAVAAPLGGKKISGGGARGGLRGLKAGRRVDPLLGQGPDAGEIAARLFVPGAGGVHLRIENRQLDRSIALAGVGRLGRGGRRGGFGPVQIGAALGRINGEKGRPLSTISPSSTARLRTAPETGAAIISRSAST